MSTEKHELDELLKLPPLVEETMPFSKFLQQLKEHPERADTAAALLVRAIKSRGEVSIEEAEKTSPEQVPYLKMLKAQGIPLYLAFQHVRGSQRTVTRIMKFLEAAAQNGYQLRQMITIIGGPGCGKTFLADALKACIEGEIAYAVKGCPVNENPINLLKLLSPGQLKALADKLEIGELLTDLLKVAGEPCAHCWKQAMKDEQSPNLGPVEVVALRLSSRHAGISAWMPGQGCSLKAALRQGSRGIVDMPEAFSVAKPAPGKTLELDALLDATEARRLTSGSDECSDSHGYLALDAVLLAQSNNGAWKDFIDAQKDPSRFTRRNRILAIPYNTSVSEEIQAYRDFLSIMKARPHLDPLALRVAATLAVASRMKPDIRDSNVPLDLRMRIYDGENIPLHKGFSRLSPSFSETDRWSGAAGASGTKTSAEAGNDALTVADLWEKAGEDEAMIGLNMGLMLSAVSQVSELALSAKGAKHRCVAAMSMLGYLRARIEIELKTPGLTREDKENLERCREHLAEPRSHDASANFVEKEYRRLLRAQFVGAFSPDYEKRAGEIFEKYRLHATAAAVGEAKVFDKSFNRKIDVDTAFLEGIEKLMGKTSEDERNRFRRGLESQFTNLLTEHAAQHGEHEKCPDVQITWRTLPELEKAISRHLDGEIAKVVERMLTDELQLDEAEKVLRAASLKRFDELGYCPHCREVALAYFKEFKLWTNQA